MHGHEMALSSYEFNLLEMFVRYLQKILSSAFLNQWLAKNPTQSTSYRRIDI